MHFSIQEELLGGIPLVWITLHGIISANVFMHIANSIMCKCRTKFNNNGCTLTVCLAKEWLECDPTSTRIRNSSSSHSNFSDFTASHTRCSVPPNYPSMDMKCYIPPTQTRCNGSEMETGRTRWFKRKRIFWFLGQISWKEKGMV